MIIVTRQMIVRTMSVAACAVLFCLSGSSSAEIPQGRFVHPRLVAGIDLNFEAYPVISASGLELYFRSDVRDDPEIWVATRSNSNGPFESVSILAEINSSSNDNPGGISSDGLTLYFGSNRSGNFGMYQATRADLSSPFGDITDLGPGVNTNELENFPFVSTDGLSLYYHKSSFATSTEHRLWMATRQDPNGTFGNAADLGDIVNGNPTIDTWKPSVSADGLTIFFSDGFFGDPRLGGKGGLDVWVSHRDSTADAFGAPMNLNDMWPGTEVNTEQLEGMAYISPDWPAVGSKLYYNSVAEEQLEIFEATWIPEPSTAVLSCLGLVCLVAWRRKKGRSRI